MGKFWVVVVSLAFALGCKQMYGGAAEPLRSPKPIKPPAMLPEDKVTVQYADDCDLFVFKPRTKIKRDLAAAEHRTSEADRKLADFDRAPITVKDDLIIDSIDELAAALRADPFNARATLKLALAYDKVHRRGCALALLARLEQLAQNPDFARDANDAIDELVQRKWFEGYRREALRAVGRPGARP